MPRETLVQYQVYCTDESVFVPTGFLLDSDSAPTSCPNDQNHTINSSLTKIVETVPSSGTFDQEGNLKTVPEPRGGSEKYFYLPNLCDKCSWYEGSERVTENLLTDSGDQTTYSSTDTHWIDLYNGRVFKEDALPNRDSYDVIVEVSSDSGSTWAIKPSSDYAVDYEAGNLSFNQALDPSDLVRATYSKAQSSTYTIAPDTGKRLKVMYVEVQYTMDLHMTSAIKFTIKAGNMPVVSEIYKRIDHFFQESTGPFPPIPPHGGPWEIQEFTGISNIESAKNDRWEALGTHHNGTDWICLMQRMTGDRALLAPIITIPFQYLAFRDIRDSQALTLEVSVEGDVVLPGSFANVTFYTLSESE